MRASTQNLENPVRIPAPLSIAGIPVVPFETYDQALDCVTEAMESGRRSFWVAINPIKIYRTWRAPELRDLLRHIDVGICDGVGISIASRILHGRGIPRITGCDLFFRLLELAAQRQWGVYLLGASPESSAAACPELQRMYPDLKIAGTQDGYFENSDEVIERINASGADLLFVAMGSPKQEEWIARHREAIHTRFCMGVEGNLDVAAGRIKRAPKVFRVTGTEFLFRFILEPRKRLSHQGILLSFLLEVIGRKLLTPPRCLKGG